MSVIPKMLVNEQDEYVVKVISNEDGDPVSFENLTEANAQMEKIGLKRFDKLRKEITEAAKNIVNPPKGGA